MKKSNKVKSYWPKGYSNQTFYDAVEGDKESVKLVIEAFTPMVHMWAKRYVYLCQGSYEDLIQEGIIGILRAVETFDLTRLTENGLKYEPSTWVWWKVRAQVQGAAQKIGNPSCKVDHAKSQVIDEEIPSPPTDNDHSIDVKGLIIEGCGSLDCRRAQIVVHRFGLMGNAPLKSWEIANKYGISKQATSNHVSKFVRKIRGKYPCLDDIISEQSF